MKHHVTHCGGCGALMLCDKLACAAQDHICYWCVQAGNAGVSLDSRAIAAELKP